MLLRLFGERFDIGFFMVLAVENTFFFCSGSLLMLHKPPILPQLNRMLETLRCVHDDGCFISTIKNRIIIVRMPILEA
jgi:hypothetical protein